MRAEPLSLPLLGELRSLAGRDAEASLRMILQDRLKRRPPEDTGKAIHDAQALSLMDWLERRGMANLGATDPAKVTRVAELYRAEFDRQLEALFEAGCAAIGAEVSRG
jgi:hypothetical protein